MDSNEMYNAINKEAALIKEQFAHGVEIIDKANFSCKGKYMQIFFSLSTAIERACKLIILIDLVLNGENLSNIDMKKYGHKLDELYLVVSQVEYNGYYYNYQKPSTQIHNRIIEVLTSFASNITRYYNIDLLTNKKHSNAVDPVSQWHTDITVPVFDKHVSQAKKTKILNTACYLGSALDNICYVQGTDNLGNNIDNNASATLEMHICNAATPHTRCYVMQIFRFLFSVLCEQSNNAMNSSVSSIPVFSDHFAGFLQDDKYYKSRKTWYI